MDPIDSHYKKLKTEIEVLEKSTEEFKVIEEYVKNTHASTHTQYSLEIAEVFKVARKGEAKRFKPFRALPNRMLLWHGSRVTNFAGILSQGLRIAPPEVRYHLNIVGVSSSIHFNFRHRSLVTCLEKEYTSPIWCVSNRINTIKSLCQCPFNSALLLFLQLLAYFLTGQQVCKLLRHEQEKQHRLASSLRCSSGQHV